MKWNKILSAKDAVSTISDVYNVSLRIYFWIGWSGGNTNMLIQLKFKKRKKGNVHNVAFHKRYK